MPQTTTSWPMPLRVKGSYPEGNHCMVGQSQIRLYLKVCHITGGLCIIVRSPLELMATRTYPWDGGTVEVNPIVGGGGGYNVSTPAPLSATVDSLARPDYPLVSENPAEAKSLRYNGSIECGLFYAKFRTLARYYGWTDDDSLLALSVSVEGPALKYFHFLYSRGGGGDELWGTSFAL